MKKVTLILAASLLVGAFIGVSLQAVRADVFPPSALIATSSPDTSTTGYTLPFGRSSSTPLYIPYSQSTTSALAVVELVSCDTIDTDANGNLFCGSDSGGSATLGSVLEKGEWKVSLLGSELSLQPTSTIKIFTNSDILSSSTISSTGKGTFEGGVRIADGMRIDLSGDGTTYIEESGGLNFVHTVNRDFHFIAGGAEQFVLEVDGGHSVAGFGTTTPYSHLTVWHNDVTATGMFVFEIANHASTSIFTINDSGGFISSASSTVLGDFTIATGNLVLSSTTPNSDGEIGINTATSSIRFHDGTSEKALYPDRDVNYLLNSQTLGQYGAATTSVEHFNSGATSTVPVWVLPEHPITVLKVKCQLIRGGTSVIVEIGNLTASTTYGSGDTAMTCTGTATSKTPTGDASFDGNQVLYLGVGNKAGNVSDVMVTVTYRIDEDTDQ